ncbi:SAM-dependent methyltransferase, partial [Nonomuraea terrae]
MPTIPSGTDPHQQRQMAESFGVDAERYDRARPSYP